jgi:acetylornithine/N-succinyldiaminopimelate aminotransferase
MGMMGQVPTYTQLPFPLTEGHGALVYDDAGREYWDFYGGHAVAVLGHSHPDVAEALCAQASQLAFYSNVAAMPLRDAAAQALCAFAPEPLKHVFFCNSGAEANENALKTAIQQTGRKRIAALKGAFHGRTLLALAATDNPKLQAPLAGLLCPTLRLEPNDISAVGQIDESIAAVIVEPVQSMAGVIELTGPYLQALRKRCDEVGALLIYDEVQTGFGRLGRNFAAGEHGVVPDMVTLAKGIANGVPMGAVLFRHAVAEKIQLNDLGSTFGGNPLACAGLQIVLETMQRNKLVQRAQQLGQRMHERLAVGPVTEVIGRGCLIGLRTPRGAKWLYEKLLQRGFITGTSGDPSILRLLPSLILPFDAIEELRESLLAIEAEESGAKASALAQCA